MRLIQQVTVRTKRAPMIPLQGREAVRQALVSFATHRSSSEAIRQVGAGHETALLAALVGGESKKTSQLIEEVLAATIDASPPRAKGFQRF